MTSKQFRQNIADNLCASIPPNAHANKGRRSLENLEENETRLTERHFAAIYEEPNYKPNCTVCSFTKSHPKRKQKDTVVSSARMKEATTFLCAFQTVSKSTTLLSVSDAKTSLHSLPPRQY